MRYLIVSVLIFILLFITAKCFAINRNLVNGMEAYEDAVKHLRKIEIELEITNDDVKYWSRELEGEKKTGKNSIFYLPDSIRFYQNKINEGNKLIQDLNIKYAEAKAVVKSLEPIKMKYDKQVERERKHDRIVTIVSSIIGMSIIPLGIVLILWISIRQEKKYKKMLKEGKITQEEYDQIMQSPNSNPFNNAGINPATGLPMTGATTDVGGNVRGSSNYHMSYDYLQEYRDRHRWDDHDAFLRRL